MRPPVPAPSRPLLLDQAAAAAPPLRRRSNRQCGHANADATAEVMRLEAAEMTQPEAVATATATRRRRRADGENHDPAPAPRLGRPLGATSKKSICPKCGRRKNDDMYHNANYNRDFRRDEDRACSYPKPRRSSGN